MRHVREGLLVLKIWYFSDYNIIVYLYKNRIIIHKSKIDTMKKINAKTTQKNIDEYLIQRWGTVKEEWKLTIKMLLDNIDLYNKCIDEIETNGLYDAATMRKNPLLSTVKDLQATMTKQIQKLGLTPYDACKIKETEEDDTNLLKYIMGEDE